MSRFFELGAAFATALVLAMGLILGEGALRDRVARGKSLALRWAIYTILDYGLMILSISLVAVARKLHFVFSTTTVIMFVFDLISAWILWELALRSASDLTLGREYRRATGLIWQRSRMAGTGAFLLLSMKSVVWDGPERMLEFFHVELDGRRSVALTLLGGLALLQALFWTGIYWAGYEVLKT